MKNIGAPNSIARYCANTSFGDNEYALFEYKDGVPVVRAAGSKDHCMSYMQLGCILVNVKNYQDRSDIGPFIEAGIFQDSDTGNDTTTCEYCGKPLMPSPYRDDVYHTCDCRV